MGTAVWRALQHNRLWLHNHAPDRGQRSRRHHHHARRNQGCAGNSGERHTAGQSGRCVCGYSVEETGHAGGGGQGDCRRGQSVVFLRQWRDYPGDWRQEYLMYLSSSEFYSVRTISIKFRQLRTAFYLVRFSKKSIYIRVSRMKIIPGSKEKAENNQTCAPLSEYCYLQRSRPQNNKNIRYMKRKDSRRTAPPKSEQTVLLKANKTKPTPTPQCKERPPVGYFFFNQPICSSQPRSKQKNAFSLLRNV